jgi:hypothetical protein
LLAGILAAGAACAAEPWIVEGRVVGVSDGDTLTPHVQLLTLGAYFRLGFR